MNVAALAAELAWRKVRELRRKRGKKVALVGLAVGGAMVAVAGATAARAAVEEAGEKAKRSLSPREWVKSLWGG